MPTHQSFLLLTGSEIFIDPKVITRKKCKVENNRIYDLTKDLKMTILGPGRPVVGYVPKNMAFTCRPMRLIFQSRSLYECTFIFSPFPFN